MDGKICFVSQYKGFHYNQLSLLYVNCGEGENNDKDHELEQNFSFHVREVERDRREPGIKHSSKVCP